MIQSDALSQRPDFTPDEDHDNEDITMLPDKMFVNLINTDLQEKIANSPEMDTDAADAIKLLLEQGPTTIQHNLDDWDFETFNGKCSEI
jgi:hypothetical protein